MPNDNLKLKNHKIFPVDLMGTVLPPSLLDIFFSDFSDTIHSRKIVAAN